MMPLIESPQPTIQLVLRPGIIDLGWGHPDPALMPVAAMRQATSAALDRFGSDALMYGADPGAGPLRDWLRVRIGQHEGRTPAPDELMLTGGSSHGLDQICTLLAVPGDVVLVESPTYHLAVRILRDHPLHLVPVPADEEGLEVEALGATLRRLQAEGTPARMLYTVPTFHNPTGTSLSPARRAALVALAAEHGLLVVEDDVYRDLAYDGVAPASLWSMAPAGTVVRLGSFAKSLAPGVRLGWLTGDAALVQRIVGGGLLDSGGGVNHFTAMMVAEFCTQGLFDQGLAQLRATYRARRDALLGALAEHMPAGCTWTRPHGGFFVWVRLPDGIDAAALLPRAEELGVSYVPGARFHLDGGGSNTLRLAWSLYGEDELREAVRRLARAIADV